MENIEKSIKSGKSAAGDMLPSMNELAAELEVSKETVKKAYFLLRDKGIISSTQGKGYYIAEQSKSRKLRILMLFDKLSNTKQVLFNSFASTINGKADITIYLHNQQISLLEYYIDENLGDFDYYVITPHFPLDTQTQKRVMKVLRRIPNRKLILLDHNIDTLAGNFGAVYQDFENDATVGLSMGMDKFSKISKLNVIIETSSLYHPYVVKAIKRENDTDKIAQLDKDIAELRDQESSFRAKWESEKGLVNKIQQDKQQIEQLKFEAERAEREGNYERVAEIRYGKLKQLDDDIKSIQNQLKSTQDGNAMIREEVTADDIAEVVSRWTGIPVTRMMQSEREKLLHLEEELHKRVIGQDEAIRAVSDAVRRSRAGLQDPKRPIASFIFLGTTGVGKTELAKALAEYLFNDETMMTRIDMSEYQEKFSVSRLIGAPPGYVGYDEGGQLTEAVRRKPYSVVLFDEIEKAHPDVFNILLQVLDDGRITDSQGRTVDFKNTVIILTSNLGSDIILNDLEQRRANGSNELSEEAKHQIDQLLKSKFRPEFLNRLDEIVYYKSLTKDEMRRIVDLQLQDLRKRMEEGKHLKLEVTTAAKDFIIDSAYDSVYGARPIKRFIQSRVETLIAKAIIQGSYTEGNTLTVDCENGALTLR